MASADVPAQSGGPAGATATVDQEGLLKAMTWWDGFMIALANPGFLIAALGGSIAGLGTLGALGLWTISVILGAFQNNIYAEMATMFPGRSGGISVYAHEAWKRYLSLVGPLATFGYWFAWSTVLSISGLIAGTLLTARFFPGATWSASGAHFHLDVPILIGIAFIIFVFFFNARGIKSAVAFSYVTGILLMIPIAVLMIFPYITGDWHSANLDWNVGANGGFALAITWLYFMGWSAYGFEAMATIAPEYRDTRDDTPKALRASAAFSVLVYALFPLGLGGTLSTAQVADDGTAIVFYKTALEQVAGGGVGTFLVLCLVGGIVLTMSTATLDGSRALYGIAQSGMTIKWLAQLNKHRVPSRGMTVDAVINIFLIVFFGTAIEILAAGNLGYIMAHVFALSGFLLLRKDRPAWPRAIKLSSLWLPVAALLALANFAFVIAGGFIYADKYGYGLSKTWVGLGVLFVSLLLYLYRRVVEDRQPIRLREPAPATPDGEDLAALEALGAPRAAPATA